MYGNIQVTVDSNPANDRSESALEANPLDPRNLVGASKRFTNPAAYQFSLAAYATFDGGHTWTEAPPLALQPGWGGLSDPVIAWDNDGHAFLVSLAFRTPEAFLGIAVYTSTDGGRSWSAPNPIHLDAWDDKPWAAGDIWPGSPHAGNVYAVWDSSSGLAFARTTNYGATWTGTGGKPAGSPLAPSSFAPEVTVGSDGTVYVVWANGGALYFVKSSDGGNSFSAPQIVAGPIVPLASPPLVAGTDGFELPGGQFRVLTLPTCTAGHGGNLVVAWADYRENVSRIYHRYTQDGGTTWLGPPSGQPLLAGGLASGPHQHDFHPQLNVRPDGVIACAFYSFGPQPEGSLAIDVVLALSFTGGVSFTTRETVTDRPWNPGVDAPLSHGDPKTTFLGEYFGLAASPAGFFPFWTDTRTGIQEMFFGLPLTVGIKQIVLFTRTLKPGETYVQFLGWPAFYHFVLTVQPKTGPPQQIAWHVESGRTAANQVKHWISVSNLTAASVDAEALVTLLAAA